MKCDTFLPAEQTLTKSGGQGLAEAATWGLPMAYQSFDGKAGDSKSGEKLAVLNLPASLAGLSLLDIGCNAKWLLRGISKDDRVTIVEGYAFRFPETRDALETAAKTAGFRTAFG